MKYERRYYAFALGAAVMCVVACIAGYKTSRGSEDPGACYPGCWAHQGWMESALATWYSMTHVPGVNTYVRFPSGSRMPAYPPFTTVTKWSATWDVDICTGEIPEGNDVPAIVTKVTMVSTVTRYLCGTGI
jgi:hypothetical protein